MVSSQGDRRWLVLGIAVLPLLTVGFDLVAVNMALPEMATSLPASTTQLFWAVAVYGLAAGAGAFVGWQVRQRFGWWRQPFAAALLLFALGSATLAWAASASTAITGRMVMGACVGVVIGLTASLHTTLFPPAERAKAVTVWAASLALGIPLAPLVAGWLLDQFWWGSVFVINIPIAILSAVLVLALPAAESSPASGRDHTGSRFSALASIPTFGWGTGLGALATFGLSVPLLLMPQFFREAIGTTALGSGLRILPVVLGLMVGSQLSEPLLPKLGLGPIVTVGFLMAAAGFGIGAFTDAGAGLVFFVVWLSVLGLGFGFSLTPALHVAVTALDPEADNRRGAPDAWAVYDMGFTFVQGVRQVAGALGVLIVGGVFNAAYPADQPVADALTSGIATAMWTSAGIMLIGAALAMVFLPRRPLGSAARHQDDRGVAAA